MYEMSGQSVVGVDCDYNQRVLLETGSGFIKMVSGQKMTDIAQLHTR